MASSSSPSAQTDSSRDTPPSSRSNTPDSESPETATCHSAIPTSTGSTTPDVTPHKLIIPADLTQAMVDADPKLKRFQQDLLVLTSFNDNDTLHWRPGWFKQEHHCKRFWTLQNPPNVVTELLPHPHLDRLVYTRRMRRDGDRKPGYVKTWEQWERYCELRGVPRDFMCDSQVGLMRLGLVRDGKGVVCALPNFPLYPEPQPRGTGRFLLTPSVYGTHLPPKFHDLKLTGSDDEVQAVVVHSDGALKVEPREEFFQHASQWTHYDGVGGYRDDANLVGSFDAQKDQSIGRRWSYLPWTKEQEESCRGEEDVVSADEKRVLKLKVRLRNSPKRKRDTVDEPLLASAGAIS
ncbi:hypothetical protein CC86DRAFT_398232 [Ophiobolus disseminans]|uniref:Uncharacterized protein n=1 Tax=Ophiobolus disseminans TaxID=1469910 RepID=A0A6A6ZIC3_9PLEO|nr:hypothetical protein CC86DRAFT_398232 [Ophiobolus disseminans]